MDRGGRGLLEALRAPRVGALVKELLFVGNGDEITHVRRIFAAKDAGLSQRLSDVVREVDRLLDLFALRSDRGGGGGLGGEGRGRDT